MWPFALARRLLAYGNFIFNVIHVHSLTATHGYILLCHNLDGCESLVGLGGLLLAEIRYNCVHYQGSLEHTYTHTHTIQNSRKIILPVRVIRSECRKVFWEQVCELGTEGAEKKDCG